MYPRNAASPPRISVGAVVQISDGAVQTAGVSIVVRPEGGAETAGAGTLSYGATSGIVYYTPTQAETDFTAFVVVAYKAGCIPAEKAVITSASATAGHAGTDQSKIVNPTSTVNLSGTTIKNATDNASQTSVDTLASYVDTEVAAIKAKTDLIQAFPTNFSLLMISGAGAIGLVDELGPQALSANGLESDISLNVWNTLTTDTFTNQSFGDRLLISTNNTREVAVTGSNHVASVLHDAEPNSIPEDAFVTGAISARVIATDAIDADALADGAITSGVFAADSITATALATSAVNEVRDAVAAITPIADLATMITNDGTANARYTVSALQNGPSGAGGSTINVYPVSASTPERVAGTTITYYRDENRAVSVVTDFVLDALTLEFVVEDSEGTDLLVIADGSISKSNKTFTVTIGTTVTGTISNYRWSLRDITSGSNSVIARGVLSVQEAASNG